jgi:hypothetical protein
MHESFCSRFRPQEGMKQLSPEAASVFGQICRQAKSGPACWFATDLEATDHFSLARLLGVSKDELSGVLKLAGVIKVD